MMLLVGRLGLANTIIYGAAMMIDRDLLEVLDDRHSAASTLITSQFPPTRWHELIGDATVADAILDRLIHGAHRIELKGESMRKHKGKER